MWMDSGSPPVSPQTPQTMSGLPGVAGVAALDAHLDELGNALVERGERVRLADLLVEVERHERGLDVVAGEAQAHLGQVVGAEGEEVGVLGDVLGGDGSALLGDVLGGDGSARNLDHGADRDVELDAVLLGDGPDVLLDEGLRPCFWSSAVAEAMAFTCMTLSSG